MIRKPIIIVCNECFFQENEGFINFVFEVECATKIIKCCEVVFVKFKRLVKIVHCLIKLFAIVRNSAKVVKGIIKLWSDFGCFCKTFNRFFKRAVVEVGYS